MPGRPKVLTSCVVILAMLMAGACSASVDRVVDAIPSSTSSATTSTTVDDTGDETSSTSTAKTTVPTKTNDVETDRYVDALTESMTADEEFPISDSQARCVAENMIDVIGADRLRGEGVLPENIGESDNLDFSTFGLSMDEGNAIYDGFGDCKVDLRGVLMESFAQDGDITPEVKSCLDTVLTDDNLRKIMVTSMVKGDDAVEQEASLEPIMNGLMGCMFMTMGSADSTP